MYAEIMGYTLATITELIEKYAAEIHVVHWDKKKLTPYEHENIKNAFFYNRSEYSSSMIKDLVRQIDPDLAVVSGWQDTGYLPAARYLKKRGIPVVVGFDDQWHGYLRQYVASFLSILLKLYFTHAWVSGPYQYEYARRLSFKKQDIIFNLYSADLDIYNDVFNQCKATKKENYPHRFLFVGRFERIKGVDLLVVAWDKIRAQIKDWELHLIGNGSLKGYLQAQPGLFVHEFMQPDKLRDEVTRSGCFILPSRGEPWGVVIHEFAAAGLPIICSDVCGASSVFLIHGLNGFIFKSEDTNSLSKQMLNIINSNDDDLFSMADYSHQLGQNITPALSAASLVSVLKNK